MTNEELLNELQAKIETGDLQKEEVLHVIEGDHDNPNIFAAKHITITKILYILGAAVTILGIIFFVSQIWDDIGAAGRVFVTFGLGLILTGIGSHLLMTKRESHLGPVFHAMGGVLVPSGALVVLSELGDNPESMWPVTITIGIVALFYALLTAYHKHPVLSFFALGLGTATLYLFVGSLTEDWDIDHGVLFAYLTMIVGLSYLMLSWAFKERWNKPLMGILNFFGSLGLLAAAFSRVFDSTLWEFLFFAVACGGIAYAVYAKSRVVLVLSTLFLIAHFIYITNEYFADSIGWPLSLVLLGFVIIGLGYFSVSINKKYLKN